jgi:hypothetical protein
MPLDGLEELSHRVVLPAEALVILAPEGLKVKGEALQEGGVQNIQDVQYASLREMKSVSQSLGAHPGWAYPSKILPAQAWCLDWGCLAWY